MRFSALSWTLPALLVIALPISARAADEKTKPPGELPAPAVSRSDLGYANMPDVQRELEMTPEQVKVLSDHWTKNQEMLANIRAGGGGFTKDQYVQQVDLLQRDYEAKIAETLNDKQTRRLPQVAMQLAGHRLLAQPAVAKLLELSPEQIAQTKEIQTRHGTEASKHFRATRNIEGGDPKARADAIASLIELDRKTEAAMQGVLTDPQRKKLDAALGTPIKFRQAFLERQHQMSN